MTNRFQKWALLTTVATYLLILMGGLVRASDAGLGCPDWPTCFGKPYPPFTQAELAERQVPADFDITNFDISKSWIEYTNRMTGAVIGLLVIGTLAYALRDHRRDKHILYPTGGAFVAVLLNGWLGSQVIESKLNQTVITGHLLLAWVQVSLLLYATVAAHYPPLPNPPANRRFLARVALLVLVIALVQGILGTNVRAQLEQIAEAHPALARGAWIGEVNWVDPVHRSYSWLVLLGVLGLAYYAHTRIDFTPGLRYITQAAVALVVVQVSAGIGLAYVDLPAPLQPVHLLVGSLLLGAITLVYLLAARLPVPQNS